MAITVRKLVEILAAQWPTLTPLSSVKSLLLSVNLIFLGAVSLVFTIASYTDTQFNPLCIVSYNYSYRTYHAESRRNDQY